MVISPQEAKTETKNNFCFEIKLNGLVWNSIGREIEAILAQIKVRSNQNRNSLTKEFVQHGATTKIRLTIKVSQEAIYSSIFTSSNFDTTKFF